MEFLDYLIEQAERHDGFECADAIKLCYQAAFGAEHMVSDNALCYLVEEAKAVGTTDEVLTEAISNDYMRVNLSAWNALGLCERWLFNMFRDTAKMGAVHDEAYMTALLDTVTDAVSNGRVDLDAHEWNAYLKKYRAGGYRPVHHSDDYRKLGSPHYRVVSREYAPVIELLKLGVCRTSPDCPLVIAIDGRAASGKTTLAELIRGVVGGCVIHMDDFFLPFDMRTDERLAEPGGNVHYERFADEVACKLSEKGTITYGAFDCYDGSMKSVSADISEFVIVEGSYSLHPKLGDYADISVFMTIDGQAQLGRIVARDGNDMAERFETTWIPLEEKYIEYYSIKDKADLIISN